MLWPWPCLQLLKRQQPSRLVVRGCTRMLASSAAGS
jgi:hypothetical protein